MMTETVVNVQEAPNNNAANKPQQTHSDGPFGWIKINLEYFKTIPGLLKIAEVIVGILCMALAQPYGYGITHFFLFVATTSFILTIIWIIIYLLGVREALTLPINWILSELVNTGIWAAFYALASLLQIISWSVGHYYSKGANIAAGVFGLVNTAVFGFATFLLIAEWKNQRPN